MDKTRITVSYGSYDFLSWAQEKHGNALLSLCRLLQTTPELSKNDDFRNALDDTLKVYGLLHGNLNGIYCGKVSSLLFQYNVEGYYFLKDLIYNGNSSKLMNEVFQSERTEDILKLIEENNHLNRTRIAELLGKSDKSNTWIREISDDIEYVHNNVKTWEWFYNKHRNDRHTFQPHFQKSFIKEVYDYFQSEEYLNAY